MTDREVRLGGGRSLRVRLRDLGQARRVVVEYGRRVEGRFVADPGRAVLTVPVEGAEPLGWALLYAAEELAAEAAPPPARTRRRPSPLCVGRAGEGPCQGGAS